MTDAATPQLRITRGPTPTDEEAAAIAAAIQVVLAAGPAAPAPPPPAPRWRFSGRWWSKPVPSRRDRPSAV